MKAMAFFIQSGIHCVTSRMYPAPRSSGRTVFPWQPVASIATLVGLNLAKKECNEPYNFVPCNLSTDEHKAVP